jgi:hypothetical protein
VTKVLTGIDSGAAFINASSQDTLVYTGTISLSIALDLLWETNVLDVHKPQTNVVIQGFGRYDLILLEDPFSQSTAHASVKRPASIVEAAGNIADELMSTKEQALAAAFASMAVRKYFALQRLCIASHCRYTGILGLF